MGRKRKAELNPQPLPPSHEEPKAAPAASTTTATISKADAVRAAVAEGITAPDDGVAWIKAKYGIEITKPMWSSYRAQDKARKAKAEAEAPVRVVRPKPAAASSNGHAGNPAELAREVKALVEKFGATAVKEMTDVFAE